MERNWFVHLQAYVTIIFFITFRCTFQFVRRVIQSIAIWYITIWNNAIRFLCILLRIAWFYVLSESVLFLAFLWRTIDNWFQMKIYEIGDFKAQSNMMKQGRFLTIVFYFANPLNVFTRITLFLFERNFMRNFSSSFIVCVVKREFLLFLNLINKWDGSFSFFFITLFNEIL